MNRKGYSLIEFVAAISLFLMLSLVLWSILGREVRMIRELSVKNELFDISEITEHILKQRLERTMTPLYIRNGEGGLQSYEDFSGGALRSFFFSEPLYEEPQRRFVRKYHVLHFKPESRKLFYREGGFSEEGLTELTGGYDIATRVESVELHKAAGGALRFSILFREGDIVYRREIFIYPEKAGEEG